MKFIPEEVDLRGNQVKNFRVHSITSTERAAIVSPVVGQVVYETDTGDLYYYTDATSTDDIARGVCFYIDGTLVVETQAETFIVPVNLTITEVRLFVDTAPTGANLIVDIHKNGTTIFTTQANRPTITAGQTSVTSVAPDVTSVVQGDRLTLEIDQVGSTVAGENLAATIIATS